MSKKKILSLIDMPFYSGMYHGILSLILGIALLIDPNKAQSKLIFLMGVFWFSSGMAILTKNPGDKTSKWLSKLLSVVAILTGFLVILRYYASTIFDIHAVSDNFAITVLGFVILLTGISHFLVEIQLGTSAARRLIHYLLAILEILLGIQLLLIPLLDHSNIRPTLISWALIGSVMFIGTAVYDHRRKKEHQREIQENEA